jgi:hypothetical protein
MTVMHPSGFTKALSETSSDGFSNQDEEVVTEIGLFLEAGRRIIPLNINIIKTSGYAAKGRGGAYYIYDPTVNAVYAAANRRTSFFNTANSRGFRLAAPSTVDVWQTGAIGDGLTDDTDAIQAAFDIAQTAGGGVVFLPVGEYKITSTLNIPGNISIEGNV